MFFSGIRKSKMVKILSAGLIILIIPLSGNAQDNRERKFEIRSGISGVLGYSKLYLDKEVMPFYSITKDFDFSYDFFFKCGAPIIIQPWFLGERIQFVSDPSFTKYSYGMDKNEIYSSDTVSYFIDVDFEEIEFPVSLRYCFISSDRRIIPYIRGEYCFSLAVNSESQFETDRLRNSEWVEVNYGEYEFASHQNKVALVAGVEFNFETVDYIIELVAEKGDGIHKRKYGSDFMKISNTTSFYLQVGVLF